MIVRRQSVRETEGRRDLGPLLREVVTLDDDDIGVNDVCVIAEKRWPPRWLDRRVVGRKSQADEIGLARIHLIYGLSAYGLSASSAISLQQLSNADATSNNDRRKCVIAAQPLSDRFYLNG